MLITGEKLIPPLLAHVNSHVIPHNIPNRQLISGINLLINDFNNNIMQKFNINNKAIH